MQHVPGQVGQSHTHLKEIPKELQPHVPDTPEAGRLQHEAPVQVQENVPQRQHRGAVVLPLVVHELQEGAAVRGLSLEGLNLLSDVRSALLPQSGAAVGATATPAAAAATAEAGAVRWRQIRIDDRVIDVPRAFHPAPPPGMPLTVRKGLGARGSPCVRVRRRGRLATASLCLDKTVDKTTASVAAGRVLPESMSEPKSDENHACFDEKARSTGCRGTCLTGTHPACLPGSRSTNPRHRHVPTGEGKVRGSGPSAREIYDAPMYEVE